MIECEHFGRMIFPSECALCSGAAAKLADEQQAAAVERTFAARWPGQCPACNLPITVGQMIRWQPGLQVIHEECAP